MNPSIERALAITPASSASQRTVDITTTGAKTGRPRRIEIWFYRSGGEIYLTTQPAVRSWYANLLANPRFTFHLKTGVRADLEARAEPVLDREARARLFADVVADLNQPLHRGYISQPVEPVEEWIERSPLMRVTFLSSETGRM